MQIRFAIQTMCASASAAKYLRICQHVCACECVSAYVCMGVRCNVCMCKMASLLGAPRSVLHCSLSHFPFFSFQNFPFSSGIFLHHIFSSFFSARFWLNCFIRHVRKFSNEQQCNLGRGSAASPAPPADVQWVTVSVTDSCSLLSKAGEVVPPLCLSPLPFPSLFPVFLSLFSAFLSSLLFFPRHSFFLLSPLRLVDSLTNEFLQAAQSEPVFHT